MYEGGDGHPFVYYLFKYLHFSHPQMFPTGTGITEFKDHFNFSKRSKDFLTNVYWLSLASGSRSIDPKQIWNYIYCRIKDGHEQEHELNFFMNFGSK